jgi:lipoprotein signal peptidase
MRFWGTIITILVLDQLSKFGISGGMILGDSKPLIDGILNLTYVHNQVLLSAFYRVNTGSLLPWHW